jgi:hypothetical protein
LASEVGSEAENGGAEQFFTDLVGCGTCNIISLRAGRLLLAFLNM